MDTTRWQMNRIGFVNFWLYDEETFEFEDGRLLLRGQNGSGKSISTQSFIPFILDGDRTPSRLDPFGSSDRRMEYYFLGEEGKDESTGYLFLEFYKEETGQYRTIGIGQRARRGKPMDFWGFVILDNRRIGQELYLYKEVGSARIPLAKNDLRKLLGEETPFTDVPGEYKALVNKHIFGFRKLEQYEQFIKLLVKVRAPKLSKEFKPTKVYEILNESLQTLTDEDLRAMVDAMEKMDGIQESLEGLNRAFSDVKIIRNEYTRYNQFMLARKGQAYLAKSRQAAEARKTFESRTAEKEQMTEELHGKQERSGQIAERRKVIEAELVSLYDTDMEEADRKLEQARGAKREADGQLHRWEERIEACRSRIGMREARIRDIEGERELTRSELADQRTNLEDGQEVLQWENHVDAIRLIGEERTQGTEEIGRMLGDYRRRLAEARGAVEQYGQVEKEYAAAEEQFEAVKKARELRMQEEEQIQAGLVEAQDEQIAVVYAQAKENAEWRLDETALRETEQRFRAYESPADADAIREIFKAAYEERHLALRRESLEAEQQYDRKKEELAALEEELERVRSQEELEPPRDRAVIETRQILADAGIEAVPFFQAVEFDQELSPAQCARIESQLARMGMLDALVVAEGDFDRIRREFPQFLDIVLHVEGEGQGSFRWLTVSTELGEELQRAVGRILGKLSVVDIAQVSGDVQRVAAAGPKAGDVQEVAAAELEVGDVQRVAAAGPKAGDVQKVAAAELEVGDVQTPVAEVREAGTCQRSVVEARDAGVEQTLALRESSGVQYGISQPSGNEEAVAISSSIGSLPQNELWMSADGWFRQGILLGKAEGEGEAEYVGRLARRRKKERLIEQLTAERGECLAELGQIKVLLSQLEGRLQRLEEEYGKAPDCAGLNELLEKLRICRWELEQIEEQYGQQEKTLAECLARRNHAYQEMLKLCGEFPFGRTVEEYHEAWDTVEEYQAAWQSVRELLFRMERWQSELATERERIEQDEQQMDDAFVEKRRCKAEGEKQEILIRKYEEYLNRPEIREQARRIEELKVEQAELEREQGEIRVRLGVLGDRIETFAKQEETLRAQLNQLIGEESCLGRFFEEELSLALVLERGNRSLAECAKEAQKTLRDSDKGREPGELFQALFQVYQSHNGSLITYGTALEPCFESGQEETQLVAGLQAVRSRVRFAAVWNGKKVYMDEFFQILRTAIEETELLIREKDRELFEDILSQTISRQLTDRIAESRRWVKDMSALMKSMDTSMGLRFSLDWKPKSAEDDEELSTLDLEQILLRDRELLTVEDITRVAAHFRSKVRAEKLRQDEAGGVVNYMDIVREALDYRKWFEFQMSYRKGEDPKKPLTNAAFNRFSGGEKAMAMYVPLFAAVNAQYQKAELKDHPRIIALDEAFAGVDDKNISSMFELVHVLDFDYIMNSQSLWGCFENVPGLRIAELLRPLNSSVVTVIRYTWNGHERVLDVQ